MNSQQMRQWLEALAVEDLPHWNWESIQGNPQDLVRWEVRTKVTVMHDWYVYLAQAIADVYLVKWYLKRVAGIQMKRSKGTAWGYSFNLLGPVVRMRQAGNLLDSLIPIILNTAKIKTGEYVTELKSEYGVANAYQIKGLGDAHPNAWRKNWLKNYVGSVVACLPTPKTSSPQIKMHRLVVESHWEDFRKKMGLKIHPCKTYPHLETIWIQKFTTAETEKFIRNEFQQRWKE